MNNLKKAMVLAGALTMTGAAWADADVVADTGEVTDAIKVEVREFKGLIENGMSSQMPHDFKAIELTEEQLAEIELALAEIQDAAPEMGTVTSEEMIEARVASHMAVKELFESVLTDEQKAELEALKAEKGDKPEFTEEEKAAFEAEMAEKKAEWEAKGAESFTKPELTEEEKAAFEAEMAEKKAEWEAKGSESFTKPELTEEEKAAFEAKKAEWEAKGSESFTKPELTEEEKAAFEAAKADRKAAWEAKKAEKEAAGN